jgi:RNA polymerase sigma-70 factor (ECF subfamily)
VSRAQVERAQLGDRDAYEELARAAAQRLFPVAVRIIRDPDRADDAVQQTLVDIWRDLPSLRDPDRFDAWTYRIVVRHCRTESRRHRIFGGDVVDVSDRMAALDDPIADVAIRDQLNRAFLSLSIDHRAVVVLHHYVGLPLAEIADILGVPYGTVGSRLHHAMRGMRASIDAAERAVIPGGQPA